MYLVCFEFVNILAKCYDKHYLSKYYDIVTLLSNESYALAMNHSYFLRVTQFNDSLTDKTY